MKNITTTGAAKETIPVNNTKYTINKLLQNDTVLNPGFEKSMKRVGYILSFCNSAHSFLLYKI